jgi:ABC-type branched-subunit amino acid transport system ATPase component
MNAGPPDRSAPALRVEGVEVRYGGTTAVTGVSCTVAPGEVVGLVGPNGAGKSTLLKAIAGLVTAQEGRFHLGEVELTGSSFARRCRAGLGLTFQIPRNAGRLTVSEELFAQSRGFRHRWLPGSRRAMDTVAGLLRELDLEAVADRRVPDLTLGEIRRFEVARALVNDPAVLLVDEPASGMTADEASLLAGSLSRLARRGVGVLLVEHNIPFLSSLADRAVVLDAGKLLIEGPTQEVLTSAPVQEAYLGASRTPR